jgi:hypothetical protein
MGAVEESGYEARDIGHRQSLYREVNERIEELAGNLDLRDELPIVCECGSTSCQERIVLRHDEYEQIRRIPTHFAVCHGHDIPMFERVVEKNERFIVVEKFGASAIVAIRLDPRRTPN